MAWYTPGALLWGWSHCEIVDNARMCDPNTWRHSLLTRQIENAKHERDKFSHEALKLAEYGQVTRELKIDVFHC